MKNVWKIILIALIILLIGVVALAYYHNYVQPPVTVIPDGPGGDVYTLKPIIYIYPEETTELTVKLGKGENLTHTYPKYENEWSIIADEDGTLIDKNTGRKLYSLYWEGKNTKDVKIDKGFVVKGNDTIKFLEEKLEILGLNYKELQEFIIYWLPQLENNKYNYIKFASMEEINEMMPLEFSVKPDTVIRILMQWKELNEPIEVQQQELIPVQRKDFTVVEWGGSEI